MDKNLHKVTSWAPGFFIDKHALLTEEAKERARNDEPFLLRPSPTGNAVARFSRPDCCKWVADRLNKTVEVESLLSKQSAAVESTLTPLEYGIDILEIDLKFVHELDPDNLQHTMSTLLRTLKKVKSILQESHNG